MAPEVLSPSAARSVKATCYDPGRVAEVPPRSVCPSAWPPESRRHLMNASALEDGAWYRGVAAGDADPDQLVNKARAIPEVEENVRRVERHLQTV